MPRTSGLKKKFFAIGAKALVVLTLLVVVFSPFGRALEIPVAQASGECAATSIFGSVAPVHDTKDYLPNGDCPYGYVDTSGASHKTSTDRSTATGGPNDPGSTDSCNGVGECLAGVVYIFTAGIGSILAYVGAYLFSVTIQLSLSSTAYAQQFVTTGWTAARDLANMFFILILVYIAVMVILKAETSGTMQSLVWVIFIALIINFSFFFTRVVIDAGNFAAVQFYNAIPVADGADGKPMLIGDKKDLTASIMNSIGVQKLLGSDSFNAFKANLGNGGWFTELITLSAIYIFAGAALFILASAFIATAIKFLMRIAMLWLMIIVSPLALIASAVPLLEDRFAQWRDTLIANAFFPVAFLFVLWLTTLFASGLTLDSTFATLAHQSGGVQPTDLANIIANVAVRMGFVIALLFLGLQAADKIGVAGANLAAKVTGNVPFLGGLKSYGNYGARMGGFAFQQLISKRAYTANEDYKENPPKTYLGQLATYNLRKGVLEPLAKTSFGGVRAYQDVADTRHHKNEEMEKDWETNLNAVQNRKDARRLGEINKTWDEDGAKYKDLKQKMHDYAEGGEDFTPYQKEYNRLEKLDTERKVLAGRIEKMSGAEISALKTADIEGIIKQVSESQLKAIKESGKHTTHAIESLNKQWQEQNAKAPIGKTKDELKKLDGIYDKLKAVGIDMKTIAERGGGATITLDNAKKALEDFEQKRDDLQADKEGADKEARREIQIKLNEVNKAIKRTEAVVDELKKVPEQVGGRTAPGEFKTS